MILHPVIMPVHGACGRGPKSLSAQRMAARAALLESARRSGILPEWLGAGATEDTVQATTQASYAAPAQSGGNERTRSEGRGSEDTPGDPSPDHQITRSADSWPDPFRTDERGVPLPTHGYYWSISHKPQYAAAVVADRPVGIDIEHVRPRRDGAHDAIATAAEWALMPDRSWHSFYRIWTAKEAVLKAVGVGIAGLDGCRVAEVPSPLHLRLMFGDQSCGVEQFQVGDWIVSVTVLAGTCEWCYTGHRTGEAIQ